MPVEEDRRAGVLFAGVGAPAVDGADAIDDGVLQPHGSDARVADGVVSDCAVRGEVAVRLDPVLPRNGGAVPIEVVEVFGLEASDRNEDAVGRAQPEVETKRVKKRAFERDAVLVEVCDVKTERLGLFGGVRREVPGA